MPLRRVALCFFAFVLFCAVFSGQSSAQFVVLRAPTQSYVTQALYTKRSNHKLSQNLSFSYQQETADTLDVSSGDGPFDYLGTIRNLKSQDLTNQGAFQPARGTVFLYDNHREGKLSQCASVHGVEDYVIGEHSQEGKQEASDSSMTQLSHDGWRDVPTRSDQQHDPKQCSREQAHEEMRDGINETGSNTRPEPYALNSFGLWGVSDG